ncbi:MFS transporter [Paucibacter sp. APW11]|uniref:MFS transporter n=1 Tax=Roseateles aquae TaxID=3077235 RepID=A0ABU3PFY0_9BURK|nr:MFS transporter [Paucibacter sp. APW11]MDT9001479.1 MFS transporter [Paucibacter sp. APW11]
MSSFSASTPASAPTASSRERQRVGWAASSAHAVHDGLTDLIYVLLPLWQSQFALSYAMTGLMRGLYAGCMAGLQLQAGHWAERWGRKALLVGGTALAGLAYLLAGQSGGLMTLMLALALGGAGASTQHPLASALVADAYQGDAAGSRRALARYNFAGDLGKMALPAAVALLLASWSWQSTVSAVGLFGLAAAALLAWLLPAEARGPAGAAGVSASATTPSAAELAALHSGGFRALLATGVIDSAVRMGFLTFLPFILQTKGAGTAGIGLALTLLFIGGAAGKLVCGWLGQRLGMMKTVWLTETATALLMLALLALPLQPLMALLPLLGVALNGTSSVLYGSVPELVSPAARTRAFSLFYTGVIGSSAIAPIVLGAIGDAWGVMPAQQALAALLLLTLPLAWRVQRELSAH